MRESSKSFTGSLRHTLQDVLYKSRMNSRTRSNAHISQLILYKCYEVLLKFYCKSYRNFARNLARLILQISYIWQKIPPASYRRSCTSLTGRHVLVSQPILYKSDRKFYASPTGYFPQDLYRKKFRTSLTGSF